MKINQNEIHIYTLNFSEDNSLLEKYNHLLSVDERKKIDQYKFPNDRKRASETFIYRRLIISNYLAVNPLMIEFNKTIFGKPVLIEPQNSGLQFNYSHTERKFLFALSKNSEIGVDIEFIKAFTDIDSLSEKYFSNDEFSFYKALSTYELKLNFFYRVWTRKEALHKGIGTGINDEMKNISVIDNDDPNKSELSIDFNNQIWQIEDLQLQDNFIGSIAYLSPIRKTMIYFDTFAYDFI
ncbi:4'-phosphopantetheinyl transferase superfamily protein [Ignavibacterium sp.]|uniref:4'-phosphopantetheinyl transferase family protein n=1 Tax=Ignavibacterium sp. TaxID=2651167 RepID=UPI00307CE5FC